MTGRFEIETMKEHDSAGCAALAQVTLGNEAWSEQSFLSHLQAHGGKALCAFSDQTIAGFVTAVCAAGDAQIYCLAVAPKFRRIGIASALVKRMIEILKAEDAERISLEVREGNKAARSFYESAGFNCAGIRPGFYSNPRENAVIMEFLKVE